MNCQARGRTMQEETRRRRRLGRGGPEVSSIGLGCMGMSHAYGPADRREALRALRHAVEIGVDLLDTADAYGDGHNEELVGEAVRHRRDDVVLATKFGLRGAPGSRSLVIDTSPEWVVAACEGSLRRLGVDTVDLYYVHRRDPRVPVEETVSAMAGLVAAGKVRWLGMSEVSPETLRAAHAVHPITAVQVEYSLFTRDVAEGELWDTCRELGVALIAYSPIGRGLLSGSYVSDEGDQRRSLPRFSEENLPSNLALAQAVRQVAADIGCTPAQAALAWVLAQGEDVVAIPGTRSVAHLVDNAAARDISLTPDQIDRLSRAVPPTGVAGERYPQHALAWVNR
ncbi:aldo/keto reductase [Nocardiopsis sp. NRRL B-16309]|uniref:aldo/keto reductase n=1 Tax=Nocardiopsis sp. NRRL B-16309 TaxID=1519494 RepID=UPI00350F836E